MSGLSDERLAPANGLQLAYQETGPADGEPLVLIMGLGQQLLGWDAEFCELLAGRGFRVVRFDNRDVGRSTKFDDRGAPSRLDVFFGRRASAAYLLADMAEDTFGLMDHLGIEAAHVTGASMGGMIAQTMAIARPQRVRSLVSMLATTGSRRVGAPTLTAMRVMLARLPRDRDEYIARGVRTFSTIGSPGYRFDRARIERVAGEMFDRSPGGGAGAVRQLHAISASGDRTRALAGLRMPVTVLHGERDPLVRPSGARATARAIPGARLRIFEGMGHDLPQALWPAFAEEIAAAAERAGAELPGALSPSGG